MPRLLCLSSCWLLALSLAGALFYLPPGALHDPSLDKYTLDCGYRGVPVERVLWKAGAYPLTGLRAGDRYIDWSDAAYHSRWYVPVLVEGGGLVSFGDRLPGEPLAAVVQRKPDVSILDIAPTATSPLGVRGAFEGRALFSGEAPAVIVLYIDSLGWYRYARLGRAMPNLSRLGEPYLATSVYPSISNVNGAAMLTGVSPELSGVDRWENRTMRVDDAVGLARRQGVSAAWIDGPVPPVSLPEGLVKVGDAGADNSTDDKASDSAVVDRAIAEHRGGTRLLYVHLSGLDRTLHATGPYSRASWEAAQRTDALAGRLLSQARPGTLLIVTADHGGHATADGKGDHGTLLPDDMLVPIFIKRARGSA